MTEGGHTPVRRRRWSGEAKGGHIARSNGGGAVACLGLLAGGVEAPDGAATTAGALQHVGAEGAQAAAASLAAESEPRLEEV